VHSLGEWLQHRDASRNDAGTSSKENLKISEGEVIGVGDTVKIATSNGEVYNFKVTAVTNQQILGDDIEIPIEEVVARLRVAQFYFGPLSWLSHWEGPWLCDIFM
jgi:hypothetical protein